LSSGPVDLKQVEEVILKEREERKALKAQLKTEKKQVELLTERTRDYEKIRSELDTCRLEMKRLEREATGKSNEIDILQNELSDLRNEKIISEQLDEEHSAKMKIYTQDLMATSLKYQQDIQGLIGRNEKLGKEVEVLKAKNAELDRLAAHTEQVKEALNKKLIGKDSEIASLQSQIDKLVREKRQLASNQPQSKQAPAVDTSLFENRIRELEAIVASQQQQLSEQENRLSCQDDAFGVLRTAKSLTPARRVSHLTSRREAQSFAPAATTSDWLEPLAIAEHVLSGVGVPN
jgi:DNA repair exonuclease SbcCD ATPase subunit